MIMKPGSRDRAKRSVDRIARADLREVQTQATSAAVVDASHDGICSLDTRVVYGNRPFEMYAQNSVCRWYRPCPIYYIQFYLGIYSSEILEFAFNLVQQVASRCIGVMDWFDQLGHLVETVLVDPDAVS